MNLALYGSGEFTPEVNQIDQYLITQFKLSRVAILPTAAGMESDVEKWISMAKNHYSKFNIEVIPIRIFNHEQANDSKLVELLDDVDWIFFSGGNPGYLLQTIKGTKLWVKVMEMYHSGVLLSGSSAGAMIMGNYILSPKFMLNKRGSGTSWEDAFGLVNYSVIPHFDHFTKNHKFMDKIINFSPEKVRLAWMGIDENTAIIFSGSNRIVKGLGGVEINDSTGIYHLN